MKPFVEQTLTLHLIRHAESLSNAGLAPRQGSVLAVHNSTLTDLGHQQARLLGGRFAKRALDHVFSSPLNRAVHTAAQIINQQPADGAGQLEVLSELTECGFPHPDTVYDLADLVTETSPAFEVQLARGLPVPEPLIHVSDEHDKDAHFERAARVLAYLTSRFSGGEEVAVVAHGAFNRYLICLLLGTRDLSRLRVAGNTGISTFVFMRQEPDGPAIGRMQAFNDLGHLYSP